MRLRKGIYLTFRLIPIALGMILVGTLPFVFGERPAARLFSFIFLVCGCATNPLWTYYVDRSGLGQRVHDFLGLTRNPYTGRYGSSQKEIEADAKRVRDSGLDKKNE